MPKLGNTTESKNIQVNPLTFSGIGLGTVLGASQFTLVSIAVDDSSSIQGDIDSIRKCLKEVVKACSRSPRAANLLLRTITFANKLNEVHGFKELKDVNVGDYDTLGGFGGSTALNDATINVLNAIVTQGGALIDQDYDANGILFVLTDGEENCSTYGTDAIKQLIAKSSKEERLESLYTVLIGIGDSSVLDSWKNETGFNSYLKIADASEKSLAKLANFISQSISSTSAAIGSSGCSKTIAVTI